MNLETKHTIQEESHRIPFLPCLHNPSQCILIIVYFSPRGGSVEMALHSPEPSRNIQTCRQTVCSSLLVILIRRSRRKTAHFHVQVRTIFLILSCRLCSAVTTLKVPLLLSLHLLPTLLSNSSMCLSVPLILFLCLLCSGS